MNNTKHSEEKTETQLFKFTGNFEFIIVNGRNVLVGCLIYMDEEENRHVCSKCGTRYTKNGLYLKFYSGVLPEPLDSQWQEAESRLNREQNCGENKLGPYETAVRLQRWSCPVCRKNGEKQCVEIDFPDFLPRYCQDTKETFISNLEEEKEDYFDGENIAEKADMLAAARKRHMFYDYIVRGKRKNDPGDGGPSYRLVCYIRFCLSGTGFTPEEFYWSIQNHNKRTR
ncbi:MAG: hypothetical protein LUG91_05155 [Ruminococcus sp.]|nr:hypothetical protein [Ruminococcus sp.]